MKKRDNRDLLLIIMSLALLVSMIVQFMTLTNPTVTNNVIKSDPISIVEYSSTDTGWRPEPGTSSVSATSFECDPDFVCELAGPPSTECWPWPKGEPFPPSPGYPIRVWCEEQCQQVDPCGCAVGPVMANCIHWTNPLDPKPVQV